MTAWSMPARSLQAHPGHSAAAAASDIPLLQKKSLSPIGGQDLCTGLYSDDIVIIGILEQFDRRIGLEAAV